MGAMKINLLAETINAMKSHGSKAPDDVRWVGTNKRYITWAEFAALADQEYDSGFGGAEVLEDLMIVGDDWWIERHEYDGSEWWEFKQQPTKPDEHATVTTLFRYDAEKQWGTDPFS